MTGCSAPSRAPGLPSRRRRFSICAALRAGANLGFQLQGADGAIDPARSCLRRKLGILLVGGFGIVRAIGTHLLEPLARLLQFPGLIGAGLVALFLRREDRIHGAGMADKRPCAGAA